MIDYKPPFAFTGDVTGEAADDMAARLRMYLARQ
jgi:hypothetical protein